MDDKRISEKLSEKRKRGRPRGMPRNFIASVLTGIPDGCDRTIYMAPATAWVMCGTKERKCNG
ncbi:MAG: hypothetical protein BWX71_00732 [Deltaproteobacteria bacterium ADurb.Bin072]|nr:MAG: hypothetical protein BWX71_00732 [Deltaproteobacteria bacterium ADurb.Bin072]